MGKKSLTKDELAILSNIPKYLEQICDAQNHIITQETSVNSYIADTTLPISNNSTEISRVKNSLSTNLLMLNELKQLSLVINDDLLKLWDAFKSKNEESMKYTYNRLKPTVKTYLQYIDTNKKIQIRNNTIIHKFLKKAELERNTIIADNQMKNAKHKKVYQSKLLLITEKKIFLPYKDEDIQKLIGANTDSKVEEIINKKFIITNVKPYKSSSSHRFTQAYKLSKTKSKKSPLAALKFALKVAKIGNLHPAIIHACNSEDQLENYIMFLNQGNPSAFTDFDVKFQINPI